MKTGRDRFKAMKAAGEPIVVLTCYDYPSAQVQEEAGVDIIFVGDSVGTNVLGYASETEVTMEDMLHHLRAVRRGVKSAYLLADLPSLAYETPGEALGNARALLAVGADGVKLEGGGERAQIVRALTDAGIEVCAHIGFTPQTIRPGKTGKAPVQGRSYEQLRSLMDSAMVLQDAGAMMIVLELVTSQLARLITERLVIPTIGIGSGPACDGQVLVLPDMLGMSPFKRRLAKAYASLRDETLRAVQGYTDDVRARRFPTEENAWPTPAEDLERLLHGSST